MIGTSSTNPIDKYSEDIAKFHQKVLDRAKQILDTYQSDNLDPESKRRFDDITSIVNQLSASKFEHAQRVLALKKSQQKNEALVMKSFLEFHLSTMNNYNAEFVKITKLQQQILDSETKKDLDQIRRDLDEMRVSYSPASSSHSYSSYDFALKSLEANEPQTFILLQHCAYLNPDAITPTLFENFTENAKSNFARLRSEYARLNAQLNYSVTIPPIFFENLSENRRTHRSSFSILKKYNLLCFDEKKGVYTIMRDLQNSLQRVHSSYFVERLITDQIAILIKETLLTFDENDCSTWEIGEECFNHVKFLINGSYWNKSVKDVQGLIFQRLSGYVAHVLLDYDKAVQFFTSYKFYYWEHCLEQSLWLNYFGEVYEKFGHYKKAIELYEKALKIEENQTYANNDQLIASLNNLGRIWIVLGDYNKGKEYSNSAFEKGKRLYKDGYHQNIALSLNNLGRAWVGLSNINKGKEYFENSLMMRKLLFKDKDHPDLAMSLSNTGLMYGLTDAVDNGKNYCNEALSMLKRIYKNKDHPFIAIVLRAQGILWSNSKDYETAKECFEASLSMQRRVYGNKDHLDIANNLESLGDVQFCLRYNALSYYEPCLAMLKRIYEGKDHHDIASILHRIGRIWFCLERYDRASSYYEEAFAMRKKLYGDNDEITQESKKALNNAKFLDRGCVIS